MRSARYIATLSLTLIATLCCAGVSIEESPTQTCFHSYVFGYSEPDELAAFATSTQASAEDCQKQCQADDMCAGFLWHTETHNCMLKNEDQIKHAINQKMTSESDIDAQFCNKEMIYTCANLYECYSCAGNPVCVWKSANHISGPQYCTDPFPVCDAETTTPAPTAAPTAKPDKPTMNPDTPTSHPDTPTIKPDTPTIKPDKSTMKPDKPTVKPDTPTIKPDKPTIKPDTPTNKPDTPTIKPDTPTIKPDTPTIKPDKPTRKPDKPTMKPDTPTTQPDTPTSKPDTPTMKPDTPTIKPDTPTTKPDTPTIKPDTPTIQPDTSTKKPDTPTNRPDTSTPKPDRPTMKPDTPTEEPDKPTSTTAGDSGESGNAVVIGAATGGAAALAAAGLAAYKYKPQPGVEANFQGSMGTAELEEMRDVVQPNDEDAFA